MKAKSGCIVIHGLTGTPETMRSVADEISRSGRIVRCPLLPGHGASEAELARVSWHQWWGCVTDAYLELCTNASSVSVVGLSLGSILALRLAIELGDKLAAVVAVSTPLILSPFVEFVHPIVKFTPARFFYRFHPKNWGESVGDPEGLEIYKRETYGRIPVRSVMELFELKKKVRSRLHEITAPLLVVHSRRDKVAPPVNIEILKSSTSSDIVESLILERSKHVATLDLEKEAAAKSIVAFLDRFE